MDLTPSVCSGAPLADRSRGPGDQCGSGSILSSSKDFLQMNTSQNQRVRGNAAFSVRQGGSGLEMDRGPRHHSGTEMPVQCH